MFLVVSSYLPTFCPKGQYTYSCIDQISTVFIILYRATCIVYLLHAYANCQLCCYLFRCMLGLLSAVMAYKTKKHLPEDKKYRKYHESAVINLTTMMALFLSTICEGIVILFLSLHIKNGLLLIITLRECFWLYPVIYLLFAPKVSIPIHVLIR